MNQHQGQVYINGQWRDAGGGDSLAVVNPANESVIAQLGIASRDDVDQAVMAARSAFPAWSQTPVEERAQFIEKIADGLERRKAEIAEVISKEMGMPLKLSNTIQASMPIFNMRQYAKLVRDYPMESQSGKALIRKEPIGVCAMITPWNFPLHQITGKVAPALAAGCTMVLKPSEIAPLDALVLAEVIDESGLPDGVFNLVNGPGPSVGEALVSHDQVDMVSFTGSTRGGIAVAKAAADKVKRVTQELGGKSANIVLDDADLAKVVSGGVKKCFMNSGQACNAPTRMLIPAEKMDEAIAVAKSTAEGLTVGQPDGDAFLGPLVSQAQFEKVQSLIQQGIDEQAQLVTGGVGKPDGLEQGYFVKPTVFAHVDNDMRIAREEIFGPVLSMIPYWDEQQAVEIANDTEYGLAAYVSGSPERAARIANQLRAGQVMVNGATFEPNAPFGGYKMSGNGREFGVYGLEEYFETKAVLGLA